MATDQAGEELIYGLCTETQSFLAENGCKIFSSFYEEMEERRKIEERKKSEGKIILKNKKNILKIFF